jgi:hypothetical protein
VNDLIEGMNETTPLILRYRLWQRKPIGGALDTAQCYKKPSIEASLKVSADVGGSTVIRDKSVPH